MSSCPALPPVCPFLFDSSRFLYLVWFSFPPSVLEWVMLILKYIFKTVSEANTLPSETTDTACEAADRAGCQIQTVNANPLVTECHTLVMLALHRIMV